MVVAAVLATLGIRAVSQVSIALLITSAQFFLWFYNGPINSVLVNCTSSALRARAFSLSILCIHLFGDAVSPFALGAASDRIGLVAAMAMVPAFLLAGALVWIWAWRTLPEPAT
jgi:hypothetical protein